MKQNKIQGYDVKDRLNCRWCTNFVPFSGNGRKICRLYELGQCKYVDGRLVKKTTSESTQIKTQMKHTKKPIKIKEDVSPDAGKGVADPMVNPVDSNTSFDKIIAIMPEFQTFVDAVGRFVDTTCPPVDQTMVNEPPATDIDVVVTDEPVTEATGDTFAVGDKIRFVNADEFGAEDWDMDEVNYQEMLEYDGEEARITREDIEGSYYSIEFRDGFELSAVSSYHFQKADVTTEATSESTYEITWVTNTNSQSKIRKEILDSGLDKNVKIEIREVKYGTSSMPIVRLTGDKDTIKNWIHKAYDQETDLDYLDELYLMDGVEIKSEGTTADGVGPDNATYEIDWVSNSTDEGKLLKEIYATGLPKTVKLKIVGNDMHPGTTIRLTGNVDDIKNWIHTEYDQEWPIDEIDDQFRVYDHKMTESTFIKNLGKRYARLGKLCR